MARRFFVAALALSACSQREATFVDLSAIGSDLAFVAITDSSGAVVRVMPPVFVSGGSPGRSAVLADGEAAFVGIGLSLDELRGEHVALDARASEAFELSVEAPPQTPAGSRDETTLAYRVSRALPAGARFVAGRLGAAEVVPEVLEDEDRVRELRRSLTLHVPVDHALCLRSNEAPLVPFARQATALPDLTAEAASITRVARLSGDRVLAMTLFDLWDLARGEDPDPTPLAPGRPARRFHATGTDGDASIAGFALERDTPEGPRVHVLGVEVPAEGDPHGWVMTLAVRDDGLELVETSSVAGEPRAIAVDENGRIAIVFADTGLVLVRERNDATWTPLGTIPDDPEIEHIWPRALDFTGDDAAPLAVALVGRVGVWRADDRSWVMRKVAFDELRPQQLTELRTNVIDYVSLASRETPEGVETWASGSAGLLLRRSPSGTWSPVLIAPPPELDPCTRPAAHYPTAVLPFVIDSIHLLDDRILFTSRSCAGIFEMRYADGCTAMIGLDGTDPVGSDKSDLQALDVRDGRIVVAGERGQLYAQ